MKAKKLLITGIVFVLVLAFFVSAEDVCIDHTAPTAPGSLSIADSPYDADGDIVLSWSAATDEPSCSGVDHYNIYKSTDNINFAKIGEATDLSFPDTGLSQGTKYYYYVTAVDKVAFNPHEGPASNTASTTIGTAPSGDGDTGGSGGGGGGGGLPPGDLWDCEEWSECIDGTQSQECTQGTATKTNTRDCEEVKPGTSGVATNTGAASDDEEGLEEPVLSGPGAPPEEQEEELGPTGAVAGPGIAASWIFLGVLIALIAALLLFIFLRKRKKS